MNYKSKETIGIIFAITAYFSFSILDTIQKSAVLYYSIFQLLFIKYIFVLLLSILEARRTKNISFYRSNNLKLQSTANLGNNVSKSPLFTTFSYLILSHLL